MACCATGDGHEEKELGAGMFCWQAKCGQRDFGHEGTSGVRMNGEQCAVHRAVHSAQCQSRAVSSVRARVETNGQPRMFVINQFVESPLRGGELGQQTGFMAFFIIP